MFDWLKNPIFKRILASAIRAGLVALGAVLVRNQIATESEWLALVDDITPILVALAWSAYEAAKVNKRIEVALEMPAGSSKAQLDRAVKLAE